MKFLMKPSSLRYDGMIPTKVCTICNHAKDIGEFRIVTNYFYGKCNDCEKEYWKEYRKSDKRKEYMDEYWKEYQKSDKYNEYQKSDKRKEYKKKYRKIPHNRVAQNLRGRVRLAIKKGYKSDSTMRTLGCSIDFLMHWLELQFKEGMTWENYGNPNGDHTDCWHIDHIKPCASFDLTDPKQQRECFHYTNLQPLWAKENISKGAKQ